MGRMDTRRLGILYQRYPNTISKTGGAPVVGIQSATGRFVIFHERIARLFPVAGRANLPLESVACCRSKPAAAIQADMIGGRAAASNSGARSPTSHSFQSEQSQPNICSSFA